MREMGGTIIIIGLPRDNRCRKEWLPREPAKISRQDSSTATRLFRPSPGSPTVQADVQFRDRQSHGSREARSASSIAAFAKSKQLAAISPKASGPCCMVRAPHRSWDNEHEGNPLRHKAVAAPVTDSSFAPQRRLPLAMQRKAPQRRGHYGARASDIVLETAGAWRDHIRGPLGIAARRRRQQRCGTTLILYGAAPPVSKSYITIGPCLT
jgi:hypothetical protein